MACLDEGNNLSSTLAKVGDKFTKFSVSLSKDLNDNAVKRQAHFRTSKLERLIEPLNHTLDEACEELAPTRDHVLASTLDNTKQNGSLAVQSLEIQREAATRAIEEDLQRFYQRFYEWLCPPKDASEDLRKIRSRLLGGTCEWIKDNEKIKQWNDTQQVSTRSRLLWLHGKMGSGKSSIVTALVADKAETSGIAYFFCQANDEYKRTTRPLLASLAWQMLSIRKDCSEDLQKDFKKRLHGEAQVSQIIEVMKCLLNEDEPMRIVIDGLDECPKEFQADTIGAFSNLSRNCMILFSSRKEGHIEHHMRILSTAFRFNELELTEDDTREDITLFIRCKTDALPASPEEREEIQAVLLQRSEGMFRYVEVMMEYLSHKLSSRAMKEAVVDMRNMVSELPRDLNALYTKIIDSIYDYGETDVAERETLENTLCWVACAARPLTLQELSAALSVAPGSANHGGIPTNRLKNLIAQHWASLFSITVEAHQGKTTQSRGQNVKHTANETIRLAHASVAEYLASSACHSCTRFHMNGNKVHDMIAEACLIYIERYPGNLIEVDESKARSYRRLRHQFKVNSFLEYAAIFWWHHSFNRNSYVSGKLRQQWQEFVSSDLLLIRWLQMFHFLLKEGRNGSQSIARAITGRFERPKRVLEDCSVEYKANTRTLPEGPAWTEHLGWPTGATTSRWASFVGTHSAPYYLPLGIAAHFDFAAWTNSFLIEDSSLTKARLEAVNSAGETPLFEAARAQSPTTFQLLLQCGADKNCHRHSRKETILSIAIKAGATHEYAVGPNHVALHLLEDPEVNVRALRLGGQTILHAFANNPDTGWECLEPLLKELFQRDIQDLIELRGVCGRTVFHTAAKFGASLCMSSILARISDSRKRIEILDFRDVLGRNALHEACLYINSGSALHVLLEHSKDMNHHTDLLGQTPLHYAAKAENETAIGILLKSGANPNAKGWDGTSPLHVAAYNDSVPIITSFAHANADLELQDSRGWTALEVAWASWRHRAVEALLELGANGDRVPALRNKTKIENFLKKRRKELRQIYSTVKVVGPPKVALTRATRRRSKRSVDYSQLVSASYPIVGRATRPVQRITFKILNPHAPMVSLEQIWVIKGAGGHFFHGPVLRRFSTSYATKEWQTVIWSADGTEETSYSDSKELRPAIASFVAELEPGDVMGIVPSNHGEDWRDFTFELEMEIVTMVE